MRLAKSILGSLVLIASTASLCFADVKHVVLVSIDGLRPDAVSRFERKHLPSFHRLITEGSYTFNARTDVDYTVTIPNHTCMVTSRGVVGEHGHGVMLNKDTDKTVHELKGSHVGGIFDVVRAEGLTSAMAASKTKFAIYAKSYPIDNVNITDQNDVQTLEYAKRLLTSGNAPAFMFVHFASTDKTGHHDGWSVKLASPYMNAVFKIDDELGVLMKAVEDLNGHGESAVLIVTTDHGGTGKNHGDERDRRNYTIPFMVWGADIAAGKELYSLNQEGRADPGHKQISYDAKTQPIRNGEAANLALHLLGLKCIDQSTIGCAPVLIVK